MAQGLEAYEVAYERLLWNLKRKAGALGYELSFGGQGESRSCIGILPMIYAEPQPA